MKIVRTLSVAATLAAAMTRVAAGQATQTVTYQISAINQIAVAGTAPTLTISTAVAGNAPTDAISSGITWAVTTNQSGAKITGAIASNMPTGVTLTSNLVQPSGATSLGAVSLSAVAADLVTGISKVNATGLGLTYTLSATALAGVVSGTRLVTFTITGGT